MVMLGKKLTRFPYWSASRRIASAAAAGSKAASGGNGSASVVTVGGDGGSAAHPPTMRPAPARLQAKSGTAAVAARLRQQPPGQPPRHPVAAGPCALHPLIGHLLSVPHLHGCQSPCRRPDRCRQPGSSPSHHQIQSRHRRDGRCESQRAGRSRCPQQDRCGD